MCILLIVKPMSHSTMSRIMPLPLCQTSAHRQKGRNYHSCLLSLENEGKVVPIELNHPSKMLSKCTEVINQSSETQRHLFVKFITV
jgi:hypothetical protein